jgi:hypothetical protein
MTNTKNITLLFILIICLTFYPYLDIRFTTLDDMQHSIMYAGQSIFNIGHNYATQQGRIFFYFSTIVTGIPHLFNNFIYYKILGLGSLLINTILIGIVIYRVTKQKSLALIYLLLFYSLIQYSFDHNLLTSYPFVFSTAINLLLISLLFFQQYLKDNKKLFLILSLSFYLLCICMYETMILYGALFLLLSYINIRNIPEEKNKLMKIVKDTYWFAIVLVFYITSYLIFRMFYPGTYDGAKIDVANKMDFFKVLYQYSIAAFPTYIFRNNEVFFIENLFNPNGQSIFAQFKIEWVIKSLIVGYILYYLLPTLKNKSYGLKKLIWFVTFSIILIVLPNILISLTSKYQYWVSIGSLSYLTAYFSFFGVIFLICSILIFLNNSFIGKRYVYKVFRIISFLLIGLLSYVTDYSNYQFAKSAEITSGKWEIMDQFMASDSFHSIQDNSVIFTPTLINTQDTYLSNAYKEYWKSYIKINSGKNITFINTKEELNQYNTQNQDIHFLKYISELKDNNQYIAFAKNIEVTNTGGTLSDKYELYSLSKYCKYIIMHETMNEGNYTQLYLDDSIKIHSKKPQHLVDVNKCNSPELLKKSSLSSTAKIDLNSILISNLYEYYEPSVDFIKFGDPKYNQYLEGFSGPEGTHRWAEGLSSSIKLPLKSKKNYNLEITMTPFVVPNKTQKVEVYLNNIQLESITLDQNENKYKIFIPSNIISSENTLVFKYSYAESPMDIYQQSDPRKLSVAFKELLITELEEEES